MKPIRGLRVIRSGAAPAHAHRQDEEDPDGDTTPDGDGDEDPEGSAGDGGDDEPPADDGRLATLDVDFSRFNTLYEIDSIFEGRFLEQVRKGSFAKTMSERGEQVKVLYNHGFDMYVHNKILAVPEVLEETDEFARLEGGLLDTSYNRDLLPGLRAGGYGSSFMFEVLADAWEFEPESSEQNPDGLPERTITEVRLYEAGPVTWPASPEATAGVRSGTDWLIEQLGEPSERDDLTRCLAAFRAAYGTRTPTGAASPRNAHPKAPAPGTGRHSIGDPVTAGSRAARLRELQLSR